jgi:hypothetical protein
MRDPSTPKPASIPQTAPLSALAASIKSNVRNILLASPDFPRLYADVVLTYAPNSNAANILAPHYQKIIDAVNAGTTLADSTNTETNNTETKQTETRQIKRTNMPTAKTCTHIKVTGIRCGSPALRGEPFCYFHQRLLRTVKSPDSRLHVVALLEDEESIQTSVMEVINALIRGTIELKRAELILRALNTAVRNSRRVRFQSETSRMIKEVPDYPTEPAAAPAQPSPTAFPPVASTNMHLRDHTFPDQWPAQKQEPAASQPEPRAAAPANVGTAAPGRPGGPAVPGRSAVNPAPTQTHVGTGALARPGGPEVPGRSPTTQASDTNKNAPGPTHRKPPMSVKESAKQAPAPKEQKTAAHRASGG